MEKTRSKKTVLYISLAVVLFVIFCLLFTAFRIINYGKEDHKTRCDVAIILGAGTYNGEVSPVYRERIHHGIWLYQNSYVDHIILTGGFGESSSISDAEAAKQYTLSKGIPEHAIFIEEKSTITEENLQYAKEIMEDQSLGTAIIVSDPLHMKRAMLMAGDYGIRAYSSPTPTTMYKSFKTRFSFLLREEFFYIGYSIVRIFR